MGGPFVLKDPTLIPISGPFHMLFFPPVHPQLPSSGHLECHLLQLACLDFP